MPQVATDGTTVSMRAVRVIALVLSAITHTMVFRAGEGCECRVATRGLFDRQENYLQTI
jgi:hypothetical protein